MRTLVASVSLLIAITLLAPAHARQCDSLVLNDDPQDVILGEAGETHCSWLWGRFVPPSYSCAFFPSILSPRLGVCWRGNDGIWHYKQTNCTGSATSNDYFNLETSGGDDRVAVLEPLHTAGRWDLLPAGGTSGAMFCSNYAWRNGTPAIAPWSPHFNFSIHASLGTGTDLFHGSPNGDEVNTNAVRVIRVDGPPAVPIVTLGSPADHSKPDLVCGWGGDDQLSGDDDDDYRSGEEDWLDGGPGNDTCDGDRILVAAPSRSMSDLWRACEDHRNAYSDEGLGLIDCSATDDPLHEWSVRFP